ncbi:hypothetical protein Bpfe_026792, partial [Biomphalaria pfeifferi]
MNINSLAAAISARHYATYTLSAPLRQIQGYWSYRFVSGTKPEMQRSASAFLEDERIVALDLS